jgi:uncharacterized protein (DUF305 family)
VLAGGTRADVESLAQRVKQAQLPEIAQRKRREKELTGSGVVAPMMDPHMMADME